MPLNSLESGVTVGASFDLFEVTVLVFSVLAEVEPFPPLPASPTLIPPKFPRPVPVFSSVPPSPYEKPPPALLSSAPHLPP